MGAIQVSGLRVQFKIENSDQNHPNGASITVWNLSRKTRAAMVLLPVPLILKAGYGSDIEQIFYGDVATNGISVVRNGPDWLTTFKVGDGLKGYRTERCQVPFPKNMNFKDALLGIIGQMTSVDTKKIAADLASGKFTPQNAFQQIVGGGAASGRTMDELNRVARSGGFKAQVTDGALELLPLADTPATRTQWPTDFVPDLGPKSGLIGSPEAVKDGFTKLRCLLRPKIKPGRQIHVKWSVQPLGLWIRVARVTHTGDTRGLEWYTDVEGKTMEGV
jgi:hypothetical protein